MMCRNDSHITLLIVFSALIIFPLLAYAGTRKHPDYVPGEVLVKFKHSVSATAKNNIHRALDSSVIKEFRKIGWQHVRLPEKMDVNEAVERLKSNPDVEYAEPNYLRRASATPNDTHFYDQWGLLKIGMDSAWNISKGFEGEVVAVIDTGVAYEHPDIIENMWRNVREIPGNAIDDDGNGYIDDIYGWNFTDNNNDPSDYNGHGTHVAGIIGAVGNNSDGVTGVNWKVRIMALKVGDATDYMTTDRIIRAIGCAVDNGAKVINASYDSYNYSYSEYDAISYANSKGVLFVAAAGNETNDNDLYPTYPASYNLQNIISVAATDQYDRLADFSNYGATTVHVAAPGVSILSTVAGRKTLLDEEFNDLNNWNQGCYLKTGGACSYSPGIVNGYWEDSPYVLYDNNSIAFLETQTPLNITGEKGICYDLSGWLDTEQIYDFVRIKIGDVLLDEVSGSYDLNETYDISSYASSPGKLKFELETDYDMQYDGVYLDHMKIESYRPSTIDDLENLGGTSMATPYVSGLAALIRSLNPSLTVSDVKNKILTTVDILPPLAGTVSTGGSINAYNALLSTGCTPPFNDVPCGYWAFGYIREIKNAGITTGCGSGNYCLGDPVTREQMAAFIIRAKEGEPPSNYCASGTPFSDVTPAMWSCKYIKRLKELGITTGYGDGTYGPYDFVPREQMAAFLIRAKIGETFTYNPTSYFADVSPSMWSFKYIQELKESSITTGYASDRYCPYDVVTRDQMAAFLWRAFLR